MRASFLFLLYLLINLMNNQGLRFEPRAHRGGCIPLEVYYYNYD